MGVAMINPRSDKRRRLEAAERLSCAVRLYLTPGETEAADLIASKPGYTGRADVLRKAFALLVQAKHPEMSKNLRKDLDTTIV